MANLLKSTLAYMLLWGVLSVAAESSPTPAPELDRLLLAVHQHLAPTGASLQAVEYQREQEKLTALATFERKRGMGYDLNCLVLDATSEGVKSTRLQGPFPHPKLINGVLWYYQHKSYAYHFRKESGEWTLFGPFVLQREVTIEKVYDERGNSHPFLLETLEHIISAREILRPISLSTDGQHTAAKAVTGFWDYSLHPVLGHLPIWPDRSDKITGMTLPCIFADSYSSFLAVCRRATTFLGRIHPDGNPIQIGDYVVHLYDPIQEFFINIQTKGKTQAIVFFVRSQYEQIGGIHAFDLVTLKQVFFIPYTHATGFYAETDTGFFFTPNGIEKISFETGERVMLGEEQQAEPTPQSP